MTDPADPATGAVLTADGELWTDEELREAVLLYRAMLDRESAGKALLKRAQLADSLRDGPLGARSAGSISRRIGNISSVLDGLGIPRMRAYGPLPNVGKNVRLRLERIIEEVWHQETTTARLALDLPVRVVPVGEIKHESFEMSGVAPRIARRVEQALLQRFRAVAVSRGRSVVAHEYAGGLRCDAYDETLDVLIEAKSDHRREFARMALGQLLDYRRYENSEPRLAVLMPRRPAPATLEFLADNGVSVVWESELGSFEDTMGGALS